MGLFLPTQYFLTASSSELMQNAMSFIFKLKQVNCKWIFQLFLQCRKILALFIKCKEVAKCLSLLDSLPFSKCLVQCFKMYRNSEEVKYILITSIKWKCDEITAYHKGMFYINVIKMVCWMRVWRSCHLNHSRTGSLRIK